VGSDVRSLRLANQRTASSSLAGNDLLIMRVVTCRESAFARLWIYSRTAYDFVTHEGITTLNGGSIFASGLSVHPVRIEREKKNSCCLVGPLYM